MRRGIHAVAYLASTISAVCLFLMMLLTAGDVVGRYLFNHPIEGSKDITELIMVIMVFLVIPYVHVVNGHVRVEIFISRLSSHTQSILGDVSSFLAAVVFALMIWQMGRRVWVSLFDPSSYQTETLGIPIAPFLFVTAIGILLLFLVILSSFVSSRGRGRE